MKTWLNDLYWKLAVSLGLVEPPRMQPIPVQAQRERTPSRR